MKRALAAPALCLSLGMCATATPPQTLCLPLTPYTPAQQATAAAELGALPAGSALAGLVIDYGRMRDADRACLARARR